MTAILDYMRLCRLCLVKDKVNVPIFGEASEVRQIFLKITACLPVKVSEEDNLPKHICDSCMYKVDLLYQFWNTTVNAEKQLIQWLGEIGVDVNIKNTSPPNLRITPQSHAHPHSMPEAIILKEERPDPEMRAMETSQNYQDSQNMYSDYEMPYQPQVNMTVGAPTDFSQPTDAPAEEEVKVPQQKAQPTKPTPAKRRGRPPKQKTPPAVKVTPPPAPPAATSTATTATGSKRRSSAAAAAAAVAAAAAANASSDESDMDDRYGDDSDDEDMDVRIAKEEADSEDEEYIDNPESLEPTAFVGVPSTSACDSEQPGPSGLGGSTTTGKTSTALPASAANESGLNIKLPPGVRIERNIDGSTNQENEKKTLKNSNTPATSNKGSIYNEFLSKVNHLTSIKIKKIEDDTNKETIKDMSNIVDNLTKFGLIVKKVPCAESDITQEDSNVPETSIKADEDFDDDNESEYEIETLDDDESDLEFVPELKRKREEKLSKETGKKTTPQQSPKKKSREFIKIKSTNYLCVMCNEKFASFDLLTSHMRSTTPCRVVVVACPVCGKEFPSKSRCSAHMYTHKEKPKYPCEKCKKQFSNPVTLQMHSEYNHTEHFDSTDEGWKCKMCDYLCDSRIRVVHHVNAKHLHISAMLCDICGKSFVRESSLRAHIMTHRETRSYLCQICSKGFKMKSSLRAHIKTHNLEKRYVCDECGKSFKKNCTLTEHKKYHAGDFSYPCIWCDKRFVSKSMLNTHMKNHSA